MILKFNKTIIIIFFALNSSCIKLAQSIIGVKSPKQLTNCQIEKTSKSFKVDQTANYRLDTSYLKFILKLDTIKFKQQIKNHIQPLQALYFNSKGELQKFYINCYAGGFPNLKWNRGGVLDVFPPKDQAPLDTVLNLNKQLYFIKPVCASTPILSIEKHNYYVFIYWNKCTKRHSKKLIKCIKKNVSLPKNENIKLVFVNYDNVFYKIELINNK
ncbi:MAG: hypothetical protein LCH32_02385 [Bacteroidetes bacterium]|nr:hypothetical protein [Bacteroidota bacterium]